MYITERLARRRRKVPNRWLRRVLVAYLARSMRCQIGTGWNGSTTMNVQSS